MLKKLEDIERQFDTVWCSGELDKLSQKELKDVWSFIDSIENSMWQCKLDVECLITEGTVEMECNMEDKQ